MFLNSGSTSLFFPSLSETKLATVIGVSLKDRGAILPAGHAANAAYWMDSEGKWITSSFYMNNLPDYVEKINDGRRVIPTIVVDGEAFSNPGINGLMKILENKA